MSEVQILDDPIAFIRKRPSMFARSIPVSGAELAANIIAEALLLTHGQVTASRADAWWVVTSDVDWIAGESDHAVEDAFSRILPLPQAGPNSMRGEVLLTAFARDVVTQDIYSRCVIKGSTQADDAVWAMLTSRPDWKRIVAFRM